MSRRNALIQTKETAKHILRHYDFSNMGFGRLLALQAHLSDLYKGHLKAHRYSQARDALIMKEEVETGMLFNNIEIDESCVYCGMCARFCNTGALAINNERTEITFNPSKCISCGLCEKSCYHFKLRYKEKLPLRLFFKDNIIAARDKSRITIADMKVFNM